MRAVSEPITYDRGIFADNLRRLMREAYRLHQDILIHPTDDGLRYNYMIAFNYMDKEEQPYAVIEKAICKALKKIAEE